MAGDAMNRMILVLSSLLLLAACQAASAPPLAGAKIGGPFALTSQDNATVRDTDFAGKYRIVYFGYTYCPDVCPTDVQNIALGLKKFEKSDPQLAAQVVPIFVTVDPARDKPAVLKQFVSAFHPRLIGLTGSDAAIAQVAKEYAVFYEKMPQTPGATGYLVNHARSTYLMDRDGKPVALLRADESGDAVYDDLKRWVR